MRAVADMVAHHPSLEKLYVQCKAGMVQVTNVRNVSRAFASDVHGDGATAPPFSAGNYNVSDAGLATVPAGVRRNPNLALQQLLGVQLADHDATLPDLDNDGWNKAVLSYYRTQARIRRRVAAVAVLRTAWHRSHGLPMRDDVGGDEAQSTRVAKLAHMVQLRRMCRVREGPSEVVEPFGRCVVAYL